MNLDEKLSRLMLSKISGIGPKRFKIIQNLFEGNITSLFNLSKKEMFKIVGEKIGLEILKFKASFDIDTYLKDLEKREIKFLVYGDTEYPNLLSQINDFPIVLYYCGNLDVLHFERAVSIVGTRGITQYGSNALKQIIMDLIDAHVVVVSGLAMGVDRFAHQYTVVNKGITYAVIPTAPDIPVPKINLPVYNSILENNGAIISEQDQNVSELHPSTFAMRNRIVAGLTYATLVIEADIKSGALITANCAFDYNRQVFALPGSIYNPKSRGTNNLIKTNKAKLVESAQDILIELGFGKYADNNHLAQKYIPVDEIETNIINELKENVLHPAQLANKLELDISTLNAYISMLEIKEVVAKDDKGNIRCML